MKITDPNRCVRQCRDEEQIARCRARVGEWTAETERMAAVLRLAANPVRLSVLRLLWEEGRLCVCDLSEILGMSIPAVSQHLKKLREGGLVEVEREGTTLYYRLCKRHRALVADVFELRVPVFGE